MNRRPLIAGAILAAIATFSVAAPSPRPQQQPPVEAHPGADADKVYPLDQIITATVHEAWLLSGRNEEAFFDIVEQLAQVSAEKRSVSLPDSAAAGKRMGEVDRRAHV